MLAAHLFSTYSSLPFDWALLFNLGYEYSIRWCVFLRRFILWWQMQAVLRGVIFVPVRSRFLVFFIHSITTLICMEYDSLSIYLERVSNILRMQSLHLDFINLWNRCKHFRTIFWLHSINLFSSKYFLFCTIEGSFTAIRE